MSEFYAEAAAVVDELLTEYGADLALTKVVTGEYDPEIGGGSQTSTTYAGVGLELDPGPSTTAALERVPRWT